MPERARAARSDDQEIGPRRPHRGQQLRQRNPDPHDPARAPAGPPERGRRGVGLALGGRAAAPLAMRARNAAGTSGIEGSRVGSITRTQVTDPPRAGARRATTATARREWGEPSTPTTMRRGRWAIA